MFLTRPRIAAAWLLLATATAVAETEPAQDAPEQYSLHAQFTDVVQYHPSFTSPYRGTNSLDPGNRGDETNDATLFAGARLWAGGEVYADAEIDQGFGLSNTLGVAGFPSGEAYKVGASEPYIRLTRAFYRQTFDLGGAAEAVSPDQNQLGGSRSADHLIVTMGKFAVTDIFDTNAYAHDPKKDFLNWSIIDGGAFDYAADAWGYSYGLAGEWTRDWWTLRGGLFDLSRVPNSRFLDRGFGQFELVTELEARQDWLGPTGKIHLLAFLNRGRMADYTEAVRVAAATGTIPEVASVRNYASRPGIILDLEQPILDDLGAFVRASANDGHKEAYEFTEINQSLSGGVALTGARWGRPDDTIGLAGVINGISRDARAYLAAGGLGILIGDGRLTHYGDEKILETYYSLGMFDGIAVSADYQFIANPAYNQDRGPVSVLALRCHAEI